MPSAALAALLALLPLALGAHNSAEDTPARARGEQFGTGPAVPLEHSLFLLQQKVKTFREAPAPLHGPLVHVKTLEEAPAPLHGPLAHVVTVQSHRDGADSSLLRISGGRPAKQGRPHLSNAGLCKAAVLLCSALALLSLFGRANPRFASMATALRFGGYYVIVSSVMIESNKWLMQPGRFPYPFTLTFNHMLTCTILANLLRKACPSLFPALRGIEVTPRYCAKYLGLGVPFMLSTVCGNWAYQFLSVSFLQIMKQTNVVTIYVLSVIVGLEALRRCSAALLLTILAGAVVAVRGELHFVLKGFLLQMVSSWSEASKVVFQSFLMSGQAKLDPLTLLLFMAPACFVANLVPWALMEGPEIRTIACQLVELWPLVLGNMVLAFILNIAVAHCIRELSAVGFLLCGIVKDNCIVLTSTFFLGEHLSHMQVVGFTIALTGVALYSLYKQNVDCFKEDSLYEGFKNVYARLMYGDPEGDAIEGLKDALSRAPEMGEKHRGSLETSPEEARSLRSTCRDVR